MIFLIFSKIQMKDNDNISLFFEIDNNYYTDLQLDETCSDISDLTDNFEEFHRHSFLRSNAIPSKKYLTKTEADWETLNSFSSEFKKAIEETRKDLGISNVSMFDEEEAIRAILGSKSNPDLSRQKTPKLSDWYEPIRLEKESSRKNSKVESTTWQILLANNKPAASFKISPPFYNCYGQKTNHWLERPDISWRKVEESRLKCETWLANT